MKQTFLHDIHIKLGAKMVDFAGWHMPVQYAPIFEEHRTVREAVGLFDVSHMGEVIVEGKDSLKFLNSIVPQQIANLKISKAVYTQLTNENGGIIDDLIIYMLDENKYLIVLNASRIDEDINWMVRNKKNYNIIIRDESYNYSMVAVQGLKAVDFIKSVYKSELPTFFSIKKDNLFDIELWISRTGYTGEDGVELIVKNEFICELWNKLIDAGKTYGIKPIGLGARDTLRLEAALPLYGNDLTENTTPIEASLGWSVPNDKIEFYNGKDIILKQKNEGVNKKLYGLKMLDKGIARHEYEVFLNDKKVGVITSGSPSPTRGDNIAMAYLNVSDEIAIGKIVQVKIREKFYNAEIIKLPFVQKRNKNI